MLMLELYANLRDALREEIIRYNLSGQKVSVRCRALSAEEAIGHPGDKDYPILKGKEILVEATFQQGRGQAFTDEFENADYSVEDLLEIDLDSASKRASFIAGLNAVYRHLGLCDRTIHCKNEEPKECSRNLLNLFEPEMKVLLVGYQPRFLEVLASKREVRVLDLDCDNIGKSISGIAIEPPEMTDDAVQWCESILASGSTIINGTIIDFLSCGKPVMFYGVTIAAAAKILNFNIYCHCGH